MAQEQVNSVIMTDDTKVYYKENPSLTEKEVWHIKTTSGTWNRYFTISYVVKDNYNVVLSESSTKVKAGDSFSVSYSYPVQGYTSPVVRLDGVIFTDTTAISNRDYNFQITVSRKTFTLRFNSVGGTAVGDMYAEYLETVTLPTITRAEDDNYKYNFLGWTDGVENYLDSVIVTGDMYFTAQWETIAKPKWRTFTLSSTLFYTTGGSVSKTLTGLRSNVPTRFYTGTNGYIDMTFSGASQATFYYTLNKSGNMLSSESGSYSASGTNRNYPNARFGYSLVTSMDKITFSPWADTLYDSQGYYNVNSYSYFFEDSGITITKIAQYY